MYKKKKPWFILIFPLVLFTESNWPTFNSVPNWVSPGATHTFIIICWGLVFKLFSDLKTFFFFRPLVYTISVLLPAAYLIGLIFTLKTHSHIYDIHISDGQGGHAHGQYAQAGTSTFRPTGEVTTGRLLADNSCINASIVTTSQVVATGVCVSHACNLLVEGTWNRDARTACCLLC